jgi:hypothetical protein
VVQTKRTRQRTESRAEPYVLKLLFEGGDVVSGRLSVRGSRLLQECNLLFGICKSLLGVGVSSSLLFVLFLRVSLQTVERQVCGLFTRRNEHGHGLNLKGGSFTRGT